jgi:hypothetical protein
MIAILCKLIQMGLHVHTGVSINRSLAYIQFSVGVLLSTMLACKDTEW